MRRGKKRSMFFNATVVGSLIFGLLFWPAAVGKAWCPATTFSGRATVVQANVLGVAIGPISDTGPLPSSGGALEASLLSVGVDGLLTANVAHATTIGQGDRSRSEASVADLNLTALGNTITADFLTARATAVCTPDGASTSGSVEIANLVVNGQPISVNGDPQTITLPNGQIRINEQTSAGPGDITVNALHVVVNSILGTIDVIISSAHADVNCQSQPVCQGGDFVTGGGWITGTPSGAKGTFAVAGGIKNGAYWGHLTYIDHGANGPKVKGTGVTAYQVVDAVTRHIEGTAEINGQSGFTYQVDVADNGEPGRNDTFALNLSNGYFASGTLAGGNIQLHKPCS
jgi:hypothetical protein